MADQPDKLLRLRGRAIVGALLGHRPAHLLLARLGRAWLLPRSIYGGIFHARLAGFEGLANNDVATAHDCHPLSKGRVETTRNGALSCAIPVSRPAREAGSCAAPVESVDRIAPAGTLGAGRSMADA